MYFDFCQKLLHWIMLFQCSVVNSIDLFQLYPLVTFHTPTGLPEPTHLEQVFCHIQHVNASDAFIVPLEQVILKHFVHIKQTWRDLYKQFGSLHSGEKPFDLALTTGQKCGHLSWSSCPRRRFEIKKKKNFPIKNSKSPYISMINIFVVWYNSVLIDRRSAFRVHK